MSKAFVCLALYVRLIVEADKHDNGWMLVLNLIAGVYAFGMWWAVTS
jgi:hypothetical protein